MGSSSSSRSDGVIKARARFSRTRQPPENVLTARECVFGWEPEPVQQLAGARAGVVTADFLEPVVGLRNRLPVFIGEGIGLRLQRRVHHHVTRQHEVDGGIGQRWHLLRDAGDAHAVGQVQVAAIGFDLVAERGEQRGLAGAVAADHAHPPPGLQGEVDVGQQQAFAPAQGEITEGDHRRILPAGSGRCGGWIHAWPPVHESPSTTAAAPAREAG